VDNGRKQFASCWRILFASCSLVCASLKFINTSVFLFVQPHAYVTKSLRLICCLYFLSLKFYFNVSHCILPLTELKQLQWDFPSPSSFWNPQHNEIILHTHNIFSTIQTAISIQICCCLNLFNILQSCLPKISIKRVVLYGVYIIDKSLLCLVNGSHHGTTSQKTLNFILAAART
jgi:hypothetical protein